ncbi:4-diphosphocytidyl-2-C-methyl-D-erythritol kinase [Primorskyibacter flagellatus]|uniref:4-diphosphocytidyl-2-C-methyl-D-erythritol kinase n=1 Tax=Primorskyibacter flagellatus TaxID=1387277 RepID=A0A917ABS3_9RHOB|nr:4-(cytidine 5'-diphospho)-2-C-methyl-D-erythritol kinase [Primorskyibacter flagellatus]GGE41060.1 4-diphosphocytidyl-2-C-methyl-D-erythritol kinase [Primorskyibacter flagellatus]
MAETQPVAEFAPAKINLTLHVTGQRPDGYHLLDSLVVFADVGDRLTLALSDTPALNVTGPRAEGVPGDARNLALRAAETAGTTVRIALDKHLPAAAGIGGGSSDAAAVLRGISRLTGLAPPDDTVRLGADVPVCLPARAARMQGVGEIVTPVADLPRLHAVLVNPGVEVATPACFARLATRTNPPMPDPLPRWSGPADLIDWLATMRNDLEPPACHIAPVIADLLETLRADPACRLARMSGSGATCFALTDTAAHARAMAARLSRPQWWVQPTRLS